MLVRLLKGRKDFQTAQMLIKSCYFLPKRTWPKNLYEMALDGLIGHKWIGIGIFDAENNLISYLDYKHVAPYKIEFGICIPINTIATTSKIAVEIFPHHEAPWTFAPFSYK